MAAHPVSGQHVQHRLDAGWYLFAFAVFLSFVVANYAGPIIAIAFGIVIAGSGVFWIRDFPNPQLPPAGFWLVGFLILGLVSAVVANILGSTVREIDLQRDIGITVSYIIFLAIGYYFAYSRASLRLILVTIAAAGLVISIVHLVKFSMVISSGVTDLYLFRLDAGRGSHTEFAALCACLVLLRDADVVKYRLMVRVTAAIVIFSMLSTLSRGLMLNLIILAIVVMALTANQFGTLIPDIVKFVLAITSVGAVVVGIYFALRFFTPAVYQFVDEFFVTRLQNSLTEVAGTRLETRDQISLNYRAFEFAQVTQHFGEQPAFAQWLGQGWGSTLKFGFDTASTKVTFTRTEASFLHNGYAYYLMKVGIVGLLLYVAFVSHLASRAISKKTWPSGDLALIRRKILLAGVVTLAIDTTTSGGLGFPAVWFGLVALLGACYGPVWGPGAEERQPTAATTSPTVSRPLNV